MKKSKVNLWFILLSIIGFSSCDKGDDLSYISIKEPNEVFRMEGVATGTDAKDVEIEFLGQKFIARDIGEYYVLQGDIKLNKSELDSINRLPKLKGAGIDGRRWPNSKVYYKINSSLPDKQRVYDAVNHIENLTNVIFVYSTYATNYIEVVYDDTSTYSSWIGKKGGRQVIGVADWATSGNVVHEFCHALGVFHEHTRNDRDDHIIVDYDHIDPDWYSQYYKYSESGYSGFDFGGFDFGSIMLYSSDYYNDGWSMTDLSGSPFLAQRYSLSNTDVSLLNYMYSTIPISIIGPTDLTNINKPGLSFSYQVDFGSYNSSSCSWKIRYTPGGNAVPLPSTSRYLTLYAQYLSELRDGQNETNDLEVYCPSNGQYVWIEITLKDGYRLVASTEPTPL